MKKKRRIRWAAVLMTVVLFISCIVGSLEIIRFQINKILGPALELLGYSLEIRDNEEYHGKLNGYVDTTSFNDRIREIYAERQAKYYENPDPVIRWFSTTNDFAQLGAVLGAFSVIALVIFGWIMFIRILFEPDEKEKQSVKKQRG